MVISNQFTAFGVCVKNKKRMTPPRWGTILFTDYCHLSTVLRLIFRNKMIKRGLRHEIFKLGKLTAFRKLLSHFSLVLILKRNS